MYVTDNVYFDGDSLYLDQTVKVIYKGPLTESEPNEIYMHYGYGAMWENLQEVKLIKSKCGYEADITFYKTGDVLFCFRDSNGKWDNYERFKLYYCSKSTNN